MKSELEGVEKVRTYPWIGIVTQGRTKVEYQYRGTTVLFSSPGVGTVIHQVGECGRGIGHSSSSWAMEAFEELNGVVKLSN